MSWRKYWHTKEFVKTESGRFCVYHGGSRDSKVSLVLLHGAGYSGLAWSTLGENPAGAGKRRIRQNLIKERRQHGIDERKREKERAKAALVKEAAETRGDSARCSSTARRQLPS